MGIPPKRNVTGKLIRRFFKKRSQVASDSSEALALKKTMVECWDKFGVDHPKCKHLIPNFDRGWAISLVNEQKYLS